MQAEAVEKENKRFEEREKKNFQTEQSKGHRQADRRQKG